MIRQGGLAQGRRFVDIGDDGSFVVLVAHVEPDAFRAAAWALRFPLRPEGAR